MPKKTHKSREVKRRKLKNPALEQQIFLEAYRATVSIKHAVEVSGITHDEFRAWLNDIPEFRARWEEIQDAAAQTLEDEAVRRAIEGCRRAVYYRGEPVIDSQGNPIYELEFSDGLLTTLLKRFRPALYRENWHVEHGGSIDLVQRMRAANERLIAMRRPDEPTGTDR